MVIDQIVTMYVYMMQPSQVPPLPPQWVWVYRSYVPRPPLWVGRGVVVVVVVAVVVAAVVVVAVVAGVVVAGVVASSSK